MQVDDVASSDLTVALKDVYAVIHVASPLAGQSDVDGILKVHRPFTRLSIASFLNRGLLCMLIGCRGWDFECSEAGCCSRGQEDRCYK